MKSTSLSAICQGQVVLRRNIHLVPPSHFISVHPDMGSAYAIPLPSKSYKTLI